MIEFAASVLFHKVRGFTSRRLIEKTHRVKVPVMRRFAGNTTRGKTPRGKMVRGKTAGGKTARGQMAKSNIKENR